MRTDGGGLAADRERVRQMPPRRLRRNEQKAATRARLLDAATRVFARKGYHAASLEQVAEEAGFSKGAVYSNFASKQELFSVLLAERCQGSLLTVTTGASGSGALADRLDRIGRAVLERCERDRDWTLLFIEAWAHAARTPGLGQFAEVYQQARGAVAGLIGAQASRLGVELPIPAELLASLCIAVTEGLALQSLVDPGRVPPEAAGGALRLLLAALVAADQQHQGGAPVAATAKQGG